MTTPPTVRRATPDDAAALVDLRQLMIESAWRKPVPDNGWRQSCEEMFREKLVPESTEWAAYVVDGPDGVPISSAVGWVQCHPPGPGDIDLFASDMGESLYADFGFTERGHKAMSWAKSR